MKRSIITILSVSALAVAQAAIPLRWTVETSRVQPAVFDIVRGETVTLEATLQSYGKPLSMDGKTCSIFYQTNGMEQAWWTGSATATSNRVAATFTPAMDPGASVINGFIGTTGEIYRAAFTLRFRKGPGSHPNVIAQPPAVLDLANTTVMNAPWPTDATIDSTIRRIISEDGISSSSMTLTPVYSQWKVTATRNLANSDISIVWGSHSQGPNIVYCWGYRISSGEFQPTEYTNTNETYISISNSEGQIVATREIDHYTTGNDNEKILAGDYESLSNRVATIGDKRYTSLENGNRYLSYASGVYNYINANTNAWFSGTNYVVGAAASTRHKFAFENGMDLTTVPCSMSLFENRDGSKQCVWDQRDWTAWYWSFKAAQMKYEISTTNAAIYTAISGRSPAAWATRTAATGLVNPDASTTWVDTDKVTLAPGMAWETVATVSGCAYWTIVGRNVQLGGSVSNAVFQIKDFEGNSVMKITKTASYLTYLEAGSDIYTSGRDSDGRVTFTMRTNVKPTAEFSTVLSEDTFIAEGEDGCPANYEWEQVSDGYCCHFILKPGIVSNACFARFKVEVQGSTTIEYEDGVTVKGGLIYNDVKIVPVIPANAANGTTITWKVVR